MNGRLLSRCSPVLLIAALLAVASTEKSANAAATSSCSARPVVDQFIDAFNRGDLASLDALFAQVGEGWAWYSVGDRAGRRTFGEAKDRRGLDAYFERRHRQRETLRIVRFSENAAGNFDFVLIRRADDLADGRPVRRLGKGRVICEKGVLGVWSLGGPPRPPWFGVCPSKALLLRRSDLSQARAAVMWFVRALYSDLNAGDIDVRGARAGRSVLATETVRGGYARIKCGLGMRKRTAVVFVQLPAMAPSASLSSPVFYASRTSRGWVVWFQIH